MRLLNPYFFQRYPLLFLTGLSLIVVVGLDLLAATMFKWWLGYPFNPRFSAAANRALEREKSYRISHPLYHHDLAKNQSTTAIFGNLHYPIFTNSLGFKDKAVREVAIATENKRLLFMGDSFTEGIGIAYEDTFVGKIEQSLSLQNIEVLNAAVASYAPSIYWRKLKYLLEEVHLKIDEVAVFIDISDAQDESCCYRINQAGDVYWQKKSQDSFWTTFLDATLRTLQNHTILLQTAITLGQSFWQTIPASNKFNYFNRDNFVWVQLQKPPEINTTNAAEDFSTFQINNFRSDWAIDKAHLQSYGVDGLKRSEESMNLLVELLKKHHIRLIVAVYPWQDQIAYHDINSIQVQFWQAWARQQKVEFINLFPAFCRDAIEERRAVLKEDFIAGDVHWSVFGHQKVADNFLGFYQKN